MGQEIVRVSDLSGQRIEDVEKQLVDIVVTDHPDLEPNEQRRLEALPGEVESLGKHAINAVGLLVTMPGEEEPTRVFLTKANFDKLATGRPMDEVLAGAALVKAVKAVQQERRSHNRTATGEPLRNFNTLDHAGEPHQGKVGQTEARLVRENLDAVNERLAAQGMPTIDPANPEHAKRYGFAAAESSEAPSASAE